MKKTLLFLFFIFSSFCFSQEICNNGLDDDGDGKIDLNDSDCNCNNSAITSLLPNHSFEEKTSCPQNYNDIATFNNWSKGTIPSPDYINADCSLFNEIYKKNLQNFPDGKGIVRAVYKNNKKEYLATKLPTPLLSGVNYQLTLNIATLMSIETSNLSKNFDFNFLQPTYVTLYGCNNKNNLPLSTTTDPTSFDSSWIEIGKVLYQPQTIWSEITLSFTTNIDINAIMLGPEKVLPPSFNTEYEPSFLYDNLILNTAEKYGVTINQSGNFCNNDLILTANLNKTFSLATAFQWYQNGIAINGANNKSYSIPSIKTNLGEYTVKVTDGNDCYISSKLTINNYIPNPSVTVIQPNCQDTNGYIKVNAPGIENSFEKGLPLLSEDYYISKDLVWQTDANFITKEYGKYYIQTRTASGCISTPTIVTINPPILLNTPSFSIIQPTCSSSGTITITSPASQFSFDNGLTWQNNATKTNLPEGNYLLKIKNSSGCESYSQSVFLFPFYIEYPTFTSTAPLCNIGGTITITTIASEYSFDNGKTWSTNPTATNLLPGAYYMKIKNESGCESQSSIHPIYFEKYYATYPEFKFIQPNTCGETGSITFLKSSYQYSIDGGQTWLETPIFTNLQVGNYVLKTKNELNCESLASAVKINSYIPKPTYTIVKPQCQTNGSITINTIAAFYSFDDGVTWEVNPTKSDLPSGMYPVKIKNALGCESDVEYVELPAFYFDEPTYKITNPNCETESKWRITITTPAAFYSSDGGVTWSTNPSFSNLVYGTYFLKIKNDLGCESKNNFVVINNEYYLDPPEYSVVQPTCTTAGSVTITTPAAFYSFDDGATWSTNPTYVHYSQGSISAYLRIKNESGCISKYNWFYIDQNLLPDPTYSMVQPTSCDDNAVGSITITSSADFYSFNNGNSWSTNPTATNLPVGFKYQLKTKNKEGCESGAPTVEFTPVKIKEAEYIAIYPTCERAGSITITTPAPFYSFDGGETWGTNPVATNLPLGYYYPKIKNESGCISETRYSVVFNEYYITGFQVEATQPTCESGNKGTITIDPLFDQYSFDGGRTWSQYNTASNLFPGDYTIRVKDNLGCQSWYRSVTLYAFYLPKPNYTTTAPICGTGGSITITTTSAFYSFDNGETWGTNPTKKDLEEGFYTIKIKNELGCESYPQNIYVPKFYLNKPLFSITQPDCEALGKITFTTNAAAYSIDNGITWSAIATFTNLNSGNYYLKIKNNLGCESNYESAYLYNVNIPAQTPTISVEQPSSCTNSKGKITISTTANLYSFDNGITWSATPTAIDLTTGDYFIKIKNSINGCQSLSVKATINPPLDAISIPNYTISQPTSCANPFGLISITTVASEYSFNNGLSWTKNANSSNLPSGLYKIKIKNAAGCESEAVIIQIIRPTDYPELPTTTILQPNCLNPKGLITITSVGSQYSFDNGLTWSLNPTSGYLSSGDYLVKIKNAAGCISEASTSIVIPFIDFPARPVAFSPQTFCIQHNATINNITVSGQNIKWFNALTNGTVLPNTTELQNGITYYASQTIDGCESDRAAIFINIQNTPTPTADANQSFCSTQNAKLSDIAITGINIKWYDASNTALPNTTLITDNTIYYASQTVNSCESVNKLAVSTFLINTLNATNYSVEFCDEDNDGKETLNLSTYNQKLIINPTGNSFSYYNSFAAAENKIVNSQINSINNFILPIGSQTLFVRIDSHNGCHQVVELNLTLYTKPIIPIQDLMPICEGSSITINAGNGHDNYLWSTGETSPTILIQNPGNYSVTVTNNYNTISCSSTKNFTVNKSTVAFITGIETQDWTDNQNTIKVFVTGQGNYEYSLDGTNFQDNNEFMNIITGKYMVHVRDKNGCGTVTEEVNLLMYPKFFTPNGDGYNDTWSIRFSENEPQLSVKIFDRYGKLITVLNQNQVWNGTYNGQLIPATDYWFVVNWADGKEYKGHFSLKR
jgi:gliding motility-associated-like protein